MNSIDTSQALPSKVNDWLIRESGLWVSDGLIDARQAEKIRSRYHAGDGVSWGMYILSAMGAVVFGLGIILFFAYNWESLPKFAKLGLVFIALLSSHLAAMYVRARSPHNRNLIEGFHLLGSMMLGAGIWLIAQIYHMDEHYPTAFAFWGAGTMLLAWAMPSVLQGLLASLLLSVWGLSEVSDFQELHWPSIMALLVGIVPLAWQLKSRVLLFFGMSAVFLLGFAMMATHLDNTLVPYVLLALATSLISISHSAASSRFPGSADVIRFMGVLLYAIFMVLMSFEFVAEELFRATIEGKTHALAISAMGVALVFAVAFAGYLIICKSTLMHILHQCLVVVALVTVSFALAGYFREESEPGLLLINAVLAAHCVLLIIMGTEELNWRHVAIGCVTLMGLVLWRFNDLFQSLLMRSLVFLIVGAMLFFIGHIYSRQKQEGQRDA